MRLPIPQAAGRGEMQRTALELLREPGEAITSRMLAERFCERRGLHLDDLFFKKVPYRASSAIGHLRQKGLVRQVGKKGANVRWAICDEVQA